ncbi:hypothetical protein [Bifidobacterium crudilactis]|jgi:hypothetical protein|uniref:hypothetical protein n=1 Tax=Bifidobacterium crudilactis TaxID=327277 RepID=UPI0023542B61|nr:hypothetical protein [Bifidobacterium crudilactis]MCI1217153.1 hypothetical protein [Bifidobacterium crudilactis]
MKKKGHAPEQSRGWILTIPATDTDRETQTRTFSQEEVVEALSRYTYAGQLERGEETGYLHWQVYVENDSPVRFSTLRKAFPTGHFEARQGTKRQALDYVSKAESFAGVRIGHGEIDTSDNQGKRSDLDLFHDLITVQNVPVGEILLKYPSAMRVVNGLRALEQECRARTAPFAPQRKMKVSYLYGATGTGKTRYLYEKFGGWAFRATDYEAPFDSYAGQKTVILDEFRSQLGRSAMLNLLDGYPTQLHGRYLNKWSAAEEVWVVSNWRLENQYENERSEDRNALFRRFYETNAVREGHIYQMMPGGNLVDETDEWRQRHEAHAREFAQFERAMNYEEIGK